MELKPLGLAEEDSKLIPSGAIPVNVFREHVDKFDENRQLLFQREFDVSDDVMMMSLINYFRVYSGPRRMLPILRPKLALSQSMTIKTDTVISRPVSDWL